MLERILEYLMEFLSMVKGLISTIRLSFLRGLSTNLFQYTLVMFFISYRIIVVPVILFVRSHIGWRGERSILYKGVETSP